MNGDFVLVNKVKSTVESPFAQAGFSLPLVSSLQHIERGDVIVFTFPGDRDEFPVRGKIHYVKRCVALAGDTVEIRDGTLIVNGKVRDVHRSTKLTKNEIDERLYPKGASFTLDYYGPLRVPQKGDVIPLTHLNIDAWEIFIKREGHTVEIVNGTIFVDGKATTSYIVERNYVFVLGDNRHRSYDSRFWGFVPEENIIGEALMVYYSKQLPEQKNSESFFDAIRWNRIGKLVQ